MDDLERMERALKAAADAGDVQAAQVIAREMRSMLLAVNPSLNESPSLGDQARAKLAKETGAIEAGTVSAGRKVSRWGRGFMELATGRKDQPNPEDEAAYAALEREHPIATAVGEAAPYVAVPASAGILPAAAAVGGLEALQPGTAGERVGRGVAGLGSTAVGGLFGKAAGNFIAPVTKKASGETYQAGLSAAERIGMRPTLAESTGSPFLRRLEDYAARAPGGSGVMAEHAARNQTAVNRAAAASMGEAADEVSPGVFAAAQKRLGQVFESIKSLGGKPIQVGQNVSVAADDILRQQAKMLPTQQDENLVALAKQAKALAANKGRIDGETYQLVRSGLSDEAFNANGTNRTLYGKLLEALDDSADASLRAGGQGALADALREARPQYANMKMLEKGATAEAGNVSPARVASTMRTQNPGAFRRGQFMDSLGDVARVGETLKPLRAGSPTFERQAVSDPLSIIWHSLFSTPIAKVATSPLATIYPRTVGNTAGARALSEIANPSTRAAVAAALMQSGALPFPVAAE